MQSRWRALGLSIGAAVIVTAVARLWIVDFYRQSSRSMSPLIAPGDVFWGNKAAIWFSGGFVRGDVIIFKQTVGDRTEIWVMRIIGLPGDVIETAGAEVSINGSPVAHTTIGNVDGNLRVLEKIGDQSHEILVSQAAAPSARNVAVKVPAGSFFVMGDNRSLARDSRYIGTVPQDKLVALCFRR
jgi:signal peptidase I